MKERAALFVATVLTWALCWTVSAAPMIQHTWDGESYGWTTAAYLGNPNQVRTEQGSAGGRDNVLRILGGDLEGVSEGEVYHPNAFAGNWRAAMPHPFGGDGVVRWVRFDFYAQNWATGNRLELYFETTLGDVWYYEITGLSSGWNDGIEIPVESMGSWYSLTRSGNMEFLEDLTRVQEVGFLLAYRSAEVNQLYALDNFVLDNFVIVPEPETYLTLGFAFLSLGITFRSRIRAAVGSVLTKVKRG
ncbi:MAG: hypothetical protein N2255_02190 [Kiritimatiellae bacterium]|nr:hypothetical protein [Kiritimatiellia bacterium]